MAETPMDIAIAAASKASKKLELYEVVREKIGMLRDDIAHMDTTNPTIYDLYQHLNSLHQKMRDLEEAGQ